MASFNVYRRSGLQGQGWVRNGVGAGVGCGISEWHCRLHASGVRSRVWSSGGEARCGGGRVRVESSVRRFAKGLQTTECGPPGGISADPADVGGYQGCPILAVQWAPQKRPHSPHQQYKSLFRLHRRLPLSKIHSHYHYHHQHHRRRRCCRRHRHHRHSSSSPPSSSLSSFPSSSPHSPSAAERHGGSHGNP